MAKKDFLNILKFSILHSLGFFLFVEAVLIFLTIVLPGRALIWLIPLMFPKTLLILFLLVFASALIIKKHYNQAEFRKKIIISGTLLYTAVTLFILIIVSKDYTQMVSSAFRRSYSSEVYRHAGNIHLQEALFFNILVIISFIICTVFFFKSWKKNAMKYLQQ